MLDSNFDQHGNESSMNEFQYSDILGDLGPGPAPTPPKPTSKSWFSCCKKAEIPSKAAPDVDFHSDSLITLSKGITAYRLIEPRYFKRNGDNDTVPLTVCLHGFWNASYMWADVSDLLSNFEQGPQSRVLIFDFYGRGRSPYSGAEITLDSLVTQTKELLDFLGFGSVPALFLGYDLGGAVALGFAAKYPEQCLSLSLISPMGMRYKSPLPLMSLRRRYYGEYIMSKEAKKLVSYQQMEFYDRDISTTHHYLIDKQVEMFEWQMNNTPGFIAALLSTCRHFPITGLEELYSVLGSHSRQVLIVLGDKDVICPYENTIHNLVRCMPNANIVDISDCGHNIIFEKFEDVVREILSFSQLVFDMAADVEDVTLMETKH